MGRQVLGRHWGTLRICIKQQQGLIVAFDAFGYHILPFGPNLLDMSIIKIHPFSNLCLKKKSRIMFAIVTDHSY
jgi:hypothetical protein